MTAEPKLPARGTITAPGHIRLESGEAIRFFDTACLRFRPEVGVEVWVIAVVSHPVGECRWRAKVVNLDGAIEPDAETQALARHEARNPLETPALARELAKLGTERREAIDALGSPWKIATETSSIDLRALAERRGERELAEYISYLRPADDRKRVLQTDAGFIDTWEYFPEPWCDPCFCPFVSGDGDSLGVFIYPPALEANLPAPVVFHSHDGSPEFSWVAESVAHLERMIATAIESKDEAAIDGERGQRHPQIEQAIRTADPTLRGEPGERERSLVRDLLFARDEEAAALVEKLAATYRERGWKFAQAALSAQRIKYEHLQKSVAESEAAAAVAIERLKGRKPLSNEGTARLFAHAVTFDFPGAPILAGPPNDPRYGKSLGFSLTREKLALSAMMWSTGFGVAGLSLLWLASRLPGIASLILALFGLVLLSPVALFGLAKIMAPSEMRFELKQRSVAFPTGFARRSMLTIPLRDVVEVGCRAGSGLERLWFRTEQKEFSVPSSMFPAEWPAAVVALRMWIRWVYARGVAPTDAKALATIEARCDEALRSSSATRFTFATLDDEARVIGFVDPGKPPVFPGATERQLDDVATRAERGTR